MFVSEYHSASLQPKIIMKIDGVEYNDVLWKIAKTMLALGYRDIPGVREVFLPQAHIMLEYRALAKRFRAKCRKLGMPFNERNFVEKNKVPDGYTAVIAIKIVPRVRQRRRR